MRFHVLALAFAATLICQAQTGKVDPSMPSYKPVTGVAGTLTIVGSDTMDTIINLWYGGFRKFHPDVTLKASMEGSTAAYLALLEGDSLIGSMSREMTKTESAAFTAKYGYTPTRLVVGLDALVIFVHPANNISSLSLEQLDAIYSTTRKQGGKDAITTWGMLGLGGDLANRKISMYGRDENAGARQSFRDRILLKGDFRPNVTVLDEASSLVERVSLDSSGIGYASIADTSSLVRTVPIMTASGTRAYPTIEGISKGDYPLTHFLYLYVNKAPGKPLPPVALAFLTYALSKEGQTSVAIGNLPIPNDVARSMLLKIQ
jgi:phosphate transport system substrate-binding protein